MITQLSETFQVREFVWNYKESKFLVTNVYLHVINENINKGIMFEIQNLEALKP